MLAVHPADVNIYLMPHRADELDSRGFLHQHVGKVLMCCLPSP